jgi:hypothetical protein
MRKKLILLAASSNALANQDWLDLESLAQVELTSEEVGHPIESAFLPNTENNWIATEQGQQTIRLLFDRPQRISCIRLQFREEEQARTQEFLLRYATDLDKPYKDIVRQQYNFSPPETSHQIENYTVNLEDVAVIELQITPDISGGTARASLAGLQLA